MKIVTKEYDLKCFRGKDIHTFEEIIEFLRQYEDKLQEYESEVVILQSEIDTEKMIREDFFKPKTPYEVHGVSERDFL